MASLLEFFEGSAKALKNNVFWGLPPPDLCGWPRCHLHRPTVPTAASEPWLSDNMYDIVVSECQRSGGAGSSTSLGEDAAGSRVSMEGTGVALER